MNNEAVYLAQVAIGVMALMLLWRFLIKPGVLDMTRDRLFILRDELRDTYINRGWGLSHSSYSAVRSLLNCHIRFAEHASFSRLIISIARLKANPEIMKAVEEDINARFCGHSVDIDAYCYDIRMRAGNILLGHSVNSSFAMLFVVHLVGICLLAQARIIRVCQGVARPLTAVFKSGRASMRPDGFRQRIAVFMEDTSCLADERCLPSHRGLAA